MNGQTDGHRPMGGQSPGVTQVQTNVIQYTISI